MNVKARARVRAFFMRGVRRGAEMTRSAQRRKECFGVEKWDGFLLTSVAFLCGLCVIAAPLRTARSLC